MWLRESGTWSSRLLSAARDCWTALAKGRSRLARRASQSCSRPRTKSCIQRSRWASILASSVFHLLPVVVAPEEEGLDGGAESGVGAVDLLERLAGGAEIKLPGLLVDAKAVAEAGEERLLEGEVAAEGVDGGDAELGGLVKEVPAEGLCVLEGAAGEGLHGEGVGVYVGVRGVGGLFEFGEDAMTHLGCGSFGEGDGDDLGWDFDFSEQAQEAAGEQIGFAGAGGGLDEDGVVGIEGALALGLIGRRGFGRGLARRGLSHWGPRRCLRRILRLGPRWARFSAMRQRDSRPQYWQVLG